jgi:tRNA-2-methylthio-N6-dimethylallyladenosine synthase
MNRAPYVDLVFGPQTYHDLPEMIARLSRQGGAVLNTSFTVEEKFDNLPETTAESGALEGASAFLTIQEGCDKFCTFCVVPYTRGAEFSRGPSEVLKEVHRLVDLSVREVTLLGQNVNNYHGLGDDGYVWGLGRLIRAIGEIAGIERIRYMTSYPADVDDALIATHQDVEQLMPFLHLPVQSGSDRILKAMNRRHGANEYRALVERLRMARPDLALSSDFIIGFPGETEDDFKATMKLVEDIGFSQAYSFKYSPRPGTPAATLENQIDETLKSERLAILQTALKAQQLAFNKSCAGSVMPVLLDRPGRNAGQMVGRSPYMQPVHVTAPEELFGTIVDLRIEEGKANSLVGSWPDGQNWASRDPSQQKVNAV